MIRAEFWWPTNRVVRLIHVALASDTLRMHSIAVMTEMMEQLVVMEAANYHHFPMIVADSVMSTNQMRKRKQFMISIRKSNETATRFCVMLV